MLRYLIKKVENDLKEKFMSAPDNEIIQVFYVQLNLPLFVKSLPALLAHDLPLSK